MPRKLRVVANPYRTLDHLGRPAGVCPFHDAIGSYVGARLHPEKTKVLETVPAGVPRSADQDTVWEFSKDVVEVPDMPFYREALRDGVLLPVDAATARAAGLKGFQPHEEALAAAREATAKRHEEAYGEPPRFLADEAEQLPAIAIAPTPTAHAEA